MNLDKLRHMAIASALVLAGLALATINSAQAAPQTYTLKVTPQTVAWGNYDATAKPVLRIHSGDTVIFDTLLTNSPAGLEKNGVPPDQIEKSLRDVRRRKDSES